MGLHRAGFEVEGWDIKPQPRYAGCKFHLGDALEADLSGFDFVWASPPCQAHSALKTMPNAKHHQDLIPDTRAKVKAWGGFYIIENVMGAPLLDPVMLCGTMFGLRTANGEAELRRHRIFESNVALMTMDCRHSAPMVCGVYGGHGRDHRRTIGVYGDSAGISDVRKERMRTRTIAAYGHAGELSVRDGTQQFSTQQRREAMGVDWMTGQELSQAVPPAYSEFLGRQVIQAMIQSERL